VALTVLVFGLAALKDIRDEQKRSAKKYRNTAEINAYMYAMLQNSGKCEICSRDASWISERRIYLLLEDKASRRELTFLVHQTTPEIQALATRGAEVIVYGALGFDPVTRFTVVNAGNPTSSYV